MIVVGVAGGLVAALRRVSERRRTGVWAGLAILRMQGRGRLIAFAVLAVCAQVARNWLMLHAIGVNVSIFDAMALLIVMFTIGQLPIGPSIGACCSRPHPWLQRRGCDRRRRGAADSHRHRWRALLRGVGDHRPDRRGPTQHESRNRRRARHRGGSHLGLTNRPSSSREVGPAPYVV